MTTLSLFLPSVMKTTLLFENVLMNDLFFEFKLHIKDYTVRPASTWERSENKCGSQCDPGLEIQTATISRDIIVVLFSVTNKTVDLNLMNWMSS